MDADTKITKNHNIGPLSLKNDFPTSVDIWGGLTTEFSLGNACVGTSMNGNL